MNHAYRVVWNEALNVWMAVAEISRRKGKTKASVLLSGLLLGASPAGAVDETFTAASGNWSDGGNWADGSAPVPATDLQLNFDNTADPNFATTHDLGNLTLNKLSVVSPFTGNTSIKIYAGDPATDRLTFDGADAEIRRSAPGDASFDTEIYTKLELDTTVTFTTDNPSSGKTLLLGGLSGSGGLTVTNGETLALGKQGEGLYSGDTTIEAGGVLFSSGLAPNSLSAASRHIVEGTLRMAESGAIGSLEGAGTVYLYNHRSLDVGALDTNTLFSGVIRDQESFLSGSLTKTGTGTLTLTGANTYTRGTTITGGALQIGDGGTSGSIAGNVVNNSSLVFNRADASTFAGDISGSGTVAKQGTGAP